MLKRLAIFAFLLAVTPMALGQPDKTVERKQESAKQSQPSVLSVDSPNKHASGQENEDKPEATSPEWYTALERPDWWLVVIAGLTGCVIGWQSWETRKAAKGAKGAADASLAQIEFMKSKERAQLRVEFARPDFAYDAKLKGYPVRFQITLDGTTRAYILEDSIIAYLNESKRTETGRRVFGIPRYLTPENSPYDGQTLIHNAERFPETETDMNKFHIARTGKDGYTLFVDGRIWYRDIFGDEWVLDIDRYWDAAVQSWGPVGVGRYDTHRKVDTSYRGESKK
jgi:hypothetical protein